MRSFRRIRFISILLVIVIALSSCSKETSDSSASVSSGAESASISTSAQESAPADSETTSVAATTTIADASNTDAVTSSTTAESTLSSGTDNTSKAATTISKDTTATKSTPTVAPAETSETASSESTSSTTVKSTPTPTNVPVSESKESSSSTSAGTPEPGDTSESANITDPEEPSSNTAESTTPEPTTPAPEVKYEVVVDGYNIAGAGTTTGTGTYKAGTNVTLKFVANDGYEFNKAEILHGNDYVETTKSTYTFTINGDVYINVYFKQVQAPTQPAEPDYRTGTVKITYDTNSEPGIWKVKEFYNVPVCCFSGPNSDPRAYKVIESEKYDEIIAFLMSEDAIGYNATCIALD